MNKPEKVKVDAGCAGELSRACIDVIAERRRQVDLGFNAEHDDGYTFGELIEAAISYLFHTVCPQDTRPEGVPEWWPWSADWWKPRTDRDNLVRAAALVLAEIERRDRLAQRQENAT